jgi:Cys-tRNA(Pro)/Cys-tRNA(Cys) deacylase
MTTNNVIRLLESRKVQFKAIELPAEKLGAVETAQFLGVDPGLVFKTIVIQREILGKPLLAVVPGDKRVDLKSLASFVNEKKVSIPTEKEAERVTGLQVGGISSLALMNRGFETLLDLSAMKLNDFYISGGMRGLLIWMRVQDYVTISGARFAPLIKIGE